jgi:PAS domain S-box-containing protein
MPNNDDFRAPSDIDGGRGYDPPHQVEDYLLEGCQVVDPELRYVYVNRAGAQHGRTAVDPLAVDPLAVDPLVGRTMAEVYPGIENTEMFSLLRRCLKERLPQRMSNEFTFPDGSTGWFELRFLPVPEGVMVLSVDISERQVAVETAWESERILRLVSENIRHMVWLMDMSLRTTWITPSVTTVRGYTLEDLTEMPLDQQLEPGSLALALELMAKHLTPEKIDAPREEIVVSTLLEFRCKDGSSFWGDTVITLLRDPDGRPTSMLGVTRDVSKHKRLQDELQESQRMMASLLANLPGMVYRCENTPQWNMEFVSKGCTALTGYRPEDLVKSRVVSFGELIHPGDRDRVYDTVQKACAAQGSFRIEYRITTANGESRWVRERGAAIRKPDGSVDAIEGFITDITPQVDAERATRLSEKKHQAMFDKLPLPAYMWRREGDDFVLDTVNEAMRIESGNKIAEWLGLTASEMLAHDPQVLSNLQRCFDSGETVREEHEYTYRTTGKTSQLIATFTFVPPDLVQLLTEDVTEKRRLEQHLHLSQRLEAVGRLAGGIAHDFNNLLTVINSNSQFALEDLHESDPIRDDIREVHKAGLRAAELTRQLLAFSRKQILHPEVMNLNRVVTNIESLLRRLLGEDIDIVVRLDEDLEHVKADPGQIEQVIMNLAVNARDAMPQGGRLTIETTNVELNENYAQQHIAVITGHYIQLTVTDTGAGIDAATQKQIFDPFFTTKRRGKGTGLGLSTVYGIVKQSGGNIWVYSEEGMGTTFKVYLPRVDEPLHPTRPKTTASLVSGHGTVLVVEDEDAVRSIVERILKAAGYTVLSAANGEEALALALSEQHTDKIDLIVTDVVMPEMSGVEVVERLAKICPRAKTLFMSGYTDDAIVHHGVLSPGTNFIAKPFTGADFTSKVHEVLEDA